MMGDVWVKSGSSLSFLVGVTFLWAINFLSVIVMNFFIKKATGMFIII